MKKVVSFLLVGVMSLGLTACGLISPKDIPTTEAAEEGTGEIPLIGVAIYKYEDNFMLFVRQSMEKAAEGRATLMMKDSQNNQDKQNEQVDTMIADGVRALAINLVDPNAAPIIAEKAKLAGIPVIFFNKEYPKGTDKIPYDKSWYVGTTSAESGIIQGQVMVDAWQANPEWDKNKDSKMQYVMLKGEPGHPDAEARTQYSIDTIEKAGIGVEELANQTGMWDTIKGKELMEAWLLAYGDKIEMVVCNNDAMALGAVEALKTNGYFEGEKIMPVVGVDAIPEALDLIRKGQMTGTVLNDAENQGEAALELAINAALGKDILEGTNWTLDNTRAVRVPYIAVTE